MAQPNLIDLQFIAARAQLIELAAFLDRAQRHGQDGDYRVQALRRTLGELAAAEPGRTRRILEALSDHSPEPIPAATIQGAFGAPLPAERV